jgi:hypothetical protein
MGLPYTFATLNLTAYSKDAQGNYVIPASALDDNFNYVLARTWVGTTAPTDTTKYCFWLDTSVSPNVFKVWDGTGWVNSYAGVIVRKNTGSNIGQRPRLNFIEGSNIGLTIADDAVDNEIDITVNGNVTVRKNTGSNIGTRPRLNFIEGSGTTLTVTDDATDNEVDITIKAGFDPTVSSVFYEEFDSAYVDTTNNIVYAGNTWAIAGATVTISSAERGGVIYFVGIGSAPNPVLNPKNSDTSLPYVSSKNPTVIVRQAQYGTDTTATRYFGLGSTGLAAAPANGIYFRHIGGGNYIGVCRSASVETTLNTGVAAANGVFHTLKFVVNGATSVEFFVDGVSKGTITTNIPTTNLYFSCGDDNTSASYGMYLNYVYISQDR